MALQGPVIDYGEGGFQNGRGGGEASEVLPQQKVGRTKKVLAMLKEGDGAVTKCFEVVLTAELEV